MYAVYLHLMHWDMADKSILCLFVAMISNDLRLKPGLNSNSDGEML